jgi:hypothetical protein
MTKPLEPGHPSDPEWAANLFTEYVGHRAWSKQLALLAATARGLCSPLNPFRDLGDQSFRYRVKALLFALSRDADEHLEQTEYPPSLCGPPYAEVLIRAGHLQDLTSGPSLQASADWRLIRLAQALDYIAAIADAIETGRLARDEKSARS